MAETTALTLPQRAAVALGTAEHEKKLLALSAKHAGLNVIKNQAGYQDCHSARMELKNERLRLEKLGKAARDDAQAFAKAVIGEQNRLIEIIEPEELRLLGLQEAWDAAEAAKKEALIRAEQERVAEIDRRIANIERLPTILVGVTLAELAAAIDTIAAEKPEEWAQEHLPRAIAAVDTALAKLGQMHAAAVAAAAEAQRLAEDRAKIERERAEFAEQQRLAQEAAAAAERARQADEAAARARREEEDRKAREVQKRNQAAFSEIQGIQQQVIIAQVGRLGVRTGGTLECAQETLKETEAWPVTEENFGTFYGAAVKAKQQAVDQIKAVIAAAEQTKAEQDRLAAQRREVEDAQRAQREADEARERAARDQQEANDRQARRAEEERQQAEAAKVRAEQEAEAERQREAQEKQAAAERERLRKEAERADARRMLELFVEKYLASPGYEMIAEDIRCWLIHHPERKAA